jgi:hypothetical protein
MRAFPIAVPAALLLASTFVPAAHAYPIAPHTLWQLVLESELVLLGQVEHPMPLESKDDDHWRSAIARVRPLEVWKGEPTGAVIEIPYPANMICPAPPVYEEGATVLAFLQKDEDGTWTTSGLSYGTLYPRAEDVPVFRDLILEAASLQSGYLVRDFARRRWLVRAATHRATRWQGLYELLSESDSLHSAFDTRADRRERRRPWASERRAVMAGFVREPSADLTVPMTVAFAGREPSAEFDAAVLGQVERVLAEDVQPYWLPEALARLAERYGAKNVPDDLGLPLDKSYRVDPQQLREAWKSYRDALSIPRVAPAAEPPHDAPGVGGRTPD